VCSSDLEPRKPTLEQLTLFPLDTDEPVTKTLQAIAEPGTHPVRWKQGTIKIKISEPSKNNEPTPPPILEEGRSILQGGLYRAIVRAEAAEKILKQFALYPEQERILNEASKKLCRVRKERCTDEELLDSVQTAGKMLRNYGTLTGDVNKKAVTVLKELGSIVNGLADRNADLRDLHKRWVAVETEIEKDTRGALAEEARRRLAGAEQKFEDCLKADFDRQAAAAEAEKARRPLDHKKMLNMLIDDLEDKYVELLEGTRAHTANVDAYIKRLSTALEDDFNTQFYHPAFRAAREASRFWDVTFGQLETTSILANNREFAKVTPEATMEFDLPKRDILINEAMNGAKAAIDDFGALVNDPTFIGLTQLKVGQSTATPGAGATGGASSVRNVLSGLPSDTAEKLLAQSGPGQQRLGTAMDALIPDPAIYKFETGTGFEIRPVIQPDGQAVVFHFFYMYTTNVREPVRADEKHLGRVKRHFIDTDVQLGNYELREISRYQVALKASRTGRGVPLLEDVPVAGVLFRPLPQQESSLRENLIYGQSVIYPTLFDLMGLRWAPAVADLDPLRLAGEEFTVRNRRRALMNRVYDHASSKVDEFLQIPEANRRPDLYRSQESIPARHPNGYQGPGLDFQDSKLQEGYQPNRANPATPFVPDSLRKGPPPPPPPSRDPPPGTSVEPLMRLPALPPESPPAAESSQGAAAAGPQRSRISWVVR
jgi:hypothetical protein